MKKTLYILTLILLTQACKKDEGRLFENPSPKETGIDFVNRIEESDELNILDYLYFYNGGGVAVGDKLITLIVEDVQTQDSAKRWRRFPVGCEYSMENQFLFEALAEIMFGLDGKGSVSIITESQRKAFRQSQP